MDAVVGLIDFIALNMEEWVSAGRKWGGAVVVVFFKFHFILGDIIAIPALGGDVCLKRIAFDP